MFCLTLIHFSLIALMGSAQYNYYHYYADKAAFFDWLEKLASDGASAGAGRGCPRRSARMDGLHRAWRPGTSR